MSSAHEPQTEPAQNLRRAEARPGRRGPGHLRTDTLDSCGPCRPSRPPAEGCPIALLLCSICEVMATSGETQHITPKFIMSSSRMRVFLCMNITLPKLSLKHQFSQKFTATPQRFTGPPNTGTCAPMPTTLQNKNVHTTGGSQTFSVTQWELWGRLAPASSR